MRAYGGASVAINLHHTAGNAAEEAFVNQRLFELAAIGVPQIVDQRGDLTRHFEPGRHVLVFRDAEELRETVRATLENPGDAALLGEAARRETLARHTYMHRMKQVLEGITAGR